MAEQQSPQPQQPPRTRTIGSFSRPSVENVQSPIRHPTIPNNNYEIKPETITMFANAVQFHGLVNENAQAHIKAFYKIMDGTKDNGVPQ
ncbi:unnamed protein product [Linum trigynum]|uniref:Reverse transcriptase domain-containing protein n=1 Tax=Linum trigynum TaxID=586398 RepID=A0AAV2DDN7_9ROSI